MKKVLAIILAVCMMAVFVPAFAVSAETEENVAPTYSDAIAGKQKLTPFNGSADTLEGYAGKQGAQINGFGCGFLDGNVYFDRLVAKTLMSALATEDVLVYVDGKLAGLAPAHAGAKDWGIGGGFQLGIINAAFKAGVESTVTLVFGNTDLYTEFTVTPTNDSIAYDSSEVVIRGTKATITVTGAAVAAAYKVGDSVTVRLHDDHVDRTFTVDSVKDNTVVMTCESFSPTDKTLVEVAYGTNRAFTTLVDTNIPGGELGAPAEGVFNVAYQTRDGEKAGQDMRFILAAKASDLAANGASIYENGTVTLTYKKGDAEVKTFSKSLKALELFKTIVANGEYWTPVPGAVLTGFIIKDVPAFAWTSMDLTIANGDTVLFAGYVEKDIKETVAMGGYVWLQGEQNINSDTGKNTGGESSIYLFDKTSSKYGFHSGGGDQTITWNYDSAKTVSLYALYSGNDSYGTDSTRHPTAWTLSGSNDNETWTVIDEVTSNPGMPVNGGSGSFYKVDAPAAYQYYKITFKTQNDYFQLGEIKMYETATTVEYNFNDRIVGITSYSSDPAASNSNEGLAQLFDNNAGTKFGFYDTTSKVTIEWSYATAQTATGYSIMTGNDSTLYGRNPDSWTLYGYDEANNTWVALDTVAVGGNFSEELMIYGIDNPAAYKTYKIEFNVANHAFQMSDIALFN